MDTQQDIKSDITRHDHMVARARELRRTATNAERLLWGHLRNRGCGGLRFRRQQPLGPFVADFYCAAAGVVVELDGSIHAGREEEDRLRQEYIERQGLKVARFTNEQVMENLEAVVEEIARVCTATLPAPARIASGSPVGSSTPHPVAIGDRPLPQGER